MNLKYNNKFILYYLYIFVIFLFFINIFKNKNNQRGSYFNAKLNKNYSTLINNLNNQTKQKKFLLECNQLHHSNYLSANDLKQICEHRNMWIKDAFYLNKTFKFNLTGFI